MSDAEWFLFVFFFFFFFWFLLSVFSFSFSFLFISSLIDVTAYRPTSAVTQRSSSQRRRRRDAHLGGRARYLPKWRPLGVNQKKNWMIWSHYLFFFVSFFWQKRPPPIGERLRRRASPPPRPISSEKVCNFLFVNYQKFTAYKGCFGVSILEREEERPFGGCH